MIHAYYILIVIKVYYCPLSVMMFLFISIISVRNDTCALSMWEMTRVLLHVNRYWYWFFLWILEYYYRSLWSKRWSIFLLLIPRLRASIGINTVRWNLISHFDDKNSGDILMVLFLKRSVKCVPNLNVYPVRGKFRIYQTLVNSSSDKCYFSYSLPHAQWTSYVL